jgi:hypothetical protein
MPSRKRGMEIWIRWIFTLENTWIWKEMEQDIKINEKYKNLVCGKK